MAAFSGEDKGPMTLQGNWKTTGMTREYTAYARTLLHCVRLGRCDLLCQERLG